MAIELISKVLWFVVGLVIVWLAIGMGVGRLDEPGAGMMSVGFGGVIALLGLGGIVHLLIKRRPVQSENPGQPQEPWTRAMLWRIGGVLVLLVVYVALLERVGFVLLTAALMSVLFGAYAGIRWVWAIPLATGLAVANYALFKLALGTQLPAGILG